MIASGPFGASEALCEALAAAGKAQTVEPGTLLFRQGEHGRGVYLVQSGKIRLSLVEKGTASTRLAGPASVLGLPATMTGNNYSLTAEALEPSEVLFIERDEVLALLRRNPEFCFEVVEILAHEVGHMRRDTAAALANVN
jgi:CRP/FNR family transcriptional regulator, cyclic AMP receptor protein